MQVLPPDEAGIAQALQILRGGGVVAHATETCYGLACDLTNPKAVEKLFAIKKRSSSQPVSGLFASIEDAQQYIEWNERAEKLASEHLPGPLTLILLMKKEWLDRLFPTPPSPPSGEGGRGGEGGQDRKMKGTHSNETKKTLGIRISSSPLATTLVQLFGKPLTTTSANLHGHENPYSAEDIQNQFADQNMKPDLILDSGILPKTPPSTVINLTTPDSSILRKGSLPLNKKSV